MLGSAAIGSIARNHGLGGPDSSAFANHARKSREIFSRAGGFSRLPGQSEIDKDKKSIGGDPAPGKKMRERETDEDLRHGREEPEHAAPGRRQP